MRVDAFAVHFVLPFARLTVNEKTRCLRFNTVQCIVSISFTYTTKPFEHTCLFKSYKSSEYRMW